MRSFFQSYILKIFNIVNFKSFVIKLNEFSVSCEFVVLVKVT